ncbi:leucine-rich repeat domain-containing protein [Candidatus Cytomitobacter indipagum]|uniref:Leucine-rich repeat domain-containing protein n=1 Tax=Candidatus Cytomitobacter indipagum TaxID=2601575 RepID=A0A5C0UET6_9PROT|nr:leucine-rich repeat domain-containing protein [Candidatus Cytomitobacter indipagum]QEK38153.1 leucine-rich repeat domain-containing protein [Candidatus Cytomitobacter indipagum]
MYNEYITLFKLNKIKNAIQITGRVIIFAIPICSYCTGFALDKLHYPMYFCDVEIESYEQKEILRREISNDIKLYKKTNENEFVEFIYTKHERIATNAFKLLCRKSNSLSKLNKEPYLIYEISSYIFDKEKYFQFLLKYQSACKIMHTDFLFSLDPFEKGGLFQKMYAATHVKKYRENMEKTSKLRIGYCEHLCPFVSFLYKNLEMLEIDYNQEIDKKILYEFKLLTELNIRILHDYCIPKNTFNHLISLVKLNLSFCKLKSIPNLFNLKNLKELDLSNNDISRIKENDLKGLESLVSLSLNYNSIKCIVSKEDHEYFSSIKDDENASYWEIESLSYLPKLRQIYLTTYTNCLYISTNAKNILEIQLLNLEIYPNFQDENTMPHALLKEVIKSIAIQ